MKLIGCWLVRTDGERRLRTLAVVYTFFILCFSIYIFITDMYHSLDDIDNFLYVAAHFLMSITSLLKCSLLYRNKQRFLKLMIYTRTHFWDIEYNEDEQVYVESARKYITFVVMITYGCVSYIAIGYICIPIYETVSGNATVIVLPFRMWPVLGIPIYDTPYFEILFIVQAFCCFQIGLSFVSLDNFLILINTHTACQFQILQHRFSNLFDTSSKLIEQPDYADRCYKNLKACIQQHQALIEYCIRAEAVFSFNILIYVVVFGVGTCLCMYQALLGDISVERRVCFILYVGGIILQLLLITHSCGILITESTNIGSVVYATLWPVLSTNRSGRMLRRHIHMIILRSQKPCQLTAGGFFPVSLQTSTKLVSTAVSYFTLLKQSSES
ncbi:odorant receptor Or2-like [Megalopta genalis]|uniref:odorant receptor Or2-like n=1 Tax=Megalopta genalis TaxID=115081 RepID=UPI003FD57B7A